MRLNSSLIHARRRDLGLAQRQLAKDLGTTSAVVASLESGDNHHALTLDFVSRLAAALAVEPALLLDAEAEHHHVDSDSGLASLLGALLLETGVLTQVTALADATGTDLVEVEDALSELERSLAPAGLVLHRRAGDVALRPHAATDPAALRTLLRSHQARRGLSISEARMLRRVMDGGVDEGLLSNPERVSLARLRRAGLVHGDRYPRLTDETESSLNPT